MELRHLRYLIAVAEEGSLSGAAARRLNTAQPSLSRQIRDLEAEVGVALLTRSAGGVRLTPAGEAFLPHARAALAQVEAAKAAARRAEQQVIVLGFVTGYEFDWLPAIMSLAREAAPDVAVRVRSESSPALAAAVQRGEVDLAILRHEEGVEGVAFRKIRDEPLAAVMRADHRLAARAEILLTELEGETRVGSSSDLSPAMRRVLEIYGEQLGIDVTPTLHAPNHHTLLSLVASANGVGLVAASADNLLPPSLVSRPITGVAPILSLQLGYGASDTSPIVRHVTENFERLRAMVRQA